MKKFSASLAALFAGGIVFAADNAVPPPPPASTTTPPSGSEAAGRTGRMGAMAEHHPIVGLIKEIETKGKVTKEEFLAHAKKQAEEAFAKLDKNGDGAIDKSEIAEIEAKLKGAHEKIQERGKGSAVRKRPGADDAKKPSA